MNLRLDEINIFSFFFLKISVCVLTPGFGHHLSQNYRSDSCMHGTGFQPFFFSPDVTENTDYTNFNQCCLVQRKKKFQFVAFRVAIKKRFS